MAFSPWEMIGRVGLSYLVWIYTRWAEANSKMQVFSFVPVSEKGYRLYGSPN